jgi:hypothetical protein
LTRDLKDKMVGTQMDGGVPMAHFTKQQLQDKDKFLKGSYKAISGAKSESGIGWNESMGMIIADPDQWLKCTKVSHFLSMK